LLIIEHAQPEVSAFGFEVFELISEIRKRISANDSRHGFSASKLISLTPESKEEGKELRN
jgi:hypothetical protein